MREMERVGGACGSEGAESDAKCVISLVIIDCNQYAVCG